MTELSPTAKSVHDAFWQGHEYPDSLSNVDLAAALRAAADQAAPEPDRGSKDTLLSFLTIRHRLLAIADELEALDV